VDFKEYVVLKTNQIEKKLDQLVPEDDVPHRILLQAARYSLLNGGKRLRPLLTLATAETLGCQTGAALTPACALEMIHTYSLIHDDLPCMDDDDYRRGKPSLHKAFPEGHAVLAGDFLLTFAFDVLAHDEQLTVQQRLKLISIMSRKSGMPGMIAGQVLDLEAEGKTIDLEQLRLIHRNKTGAIITASIEFGGVVAGASEDQMKILAQFGHDVGLAFQIIDDVLDVTASKKKPGKSVGSDIENGKATYVSLMGLDQAREMAYQLLESSKKVIKPLAKNTTLLVQFADRLVNREF
jgi:geranylgeranyl diphosphate synthase type II